MYLHGLINHNHGRFRTTMCHGLFFTSSNSQTYAKIRERFHYIWFSKMTFRYMILRATNTCMWNIYTILFMNFTRWPPLSSSRLSVRLCFSEKNWYIFNARKVPFWSLLMWNHPSIMYHFLSIPLDCTIHQTHSMIHDVKCTRY